MFYLSQEDYEKKLKKIHKYNLSKERKRALKEAKDINKKKRISTTKLITLYLFIVLNIVLGYALIAMWHFSNLSYLGTLIADVIGQILVFFIYSIKSTKENTQGGITYETTMAQLEYEHHNQEEIMG